MNPLPDPTAGIVPTPSPDRVDQAWSGGLSLGSLLSGATAMLAQVPQGTAVAVAGVFGSVFIQVSSQWNNKRTAQLERDVFHAQAQATAAAARIATLIAQRDAMQDEIMTLNRELRQLNALLLEHAVEIPADLHKTLADAAKPAPVPTAIIEPDHDAASEPADAPGGVS